MLSYINQSQSIQNYIFTNYLKPYTQDFELFYFEIHYFETCKLFKHAEINLNNRWDLENIYILKLKILFPFGLNS